MIDIKDPELFGKIVASEVASIKDSNLLTSGEQISFVNVLAKATARIESSGAFMDFDAEADRLLIWSDSNEIYEIGSDKTCRCLAAMNGRVCWHRAAKKIISRYLAAEKIEDRIETLTDIGCSRNEAKTIAEVQI